MGGLNKIAWHCKDRFYWDQSDQIVTLSVSISRLTNSQRRGNDAMIEITPYSKFLQVLSWRLVKHEQALLTWAENSETKIIF